MLFSSPEVFQNNVNTIISGMICACFPSVRKITEQLLASVDHLFYTVLYAKPFTRFTSFESNAYGHLELNTMIILTLQRPRLLKQPVHNLSIN